MEINLNFSPDYKYIRNQVDTLCVFAGSNLDIYAYKYI